MDNNNPIQINNQEPQSKSVLNFSGKIELKKIILQILIVCLLANSAIAVVAVLTSGFNEVLIRAFWTIILMAVHTILSLSYINYILSQQHTRSETSTEFFNNVNLGLIVASFLISILGVWSILSPDLTVRMYWLMGILLFANIHSELLNNVRKYSPKIDMVIKVNYVLICIVVFMLSIVIFSPDYQDLSEGFYRLLAAFIIIDATATLTSLIMYKMYTQQHPELAAESNTESNGQKKSIWKTALIILLILWLAPQLFFLVIALLFGLAASSV